MALTEEKIFAQVIRDIPSNTISVKWDNVIMRDDEVISRIPHRCVYLPGEKSKLLVECPEAAPEVSAMGW